MLTGSDLLNKVKELGDVSKSELVRECGYVSTKKDGSERLNFTAFYEAVLEAKGMLLSGKSSGKSRGRSLSFITRVQFNGNLMVGKAYTAQLGLQPGDEFEIKLGRKQIRLIPLSEKEFEASEMNPHIESLHDEETETEEEIMEQTENKTEVESWTFEEVPTMSIEMVEPEPLTV